MKYIKLVIALFILMIIIGASPTVLAIDTGLTTQQLSNEEISDIITQVEFVKMTSYTPLAVKCFDVRDDHKIVIGTNVGNTAYIAVCDACGNFQYGFETEQLGSFRVMWSGDHIAFYCIRSELLFEIDENGKIVDICRVESTTENSVYDRDVLLSTTRKVGTSTYRMTNESTVADAFSVSYKKIIKTDGEETTVIYDASGDKNVRVVRGLIIGMLLSSLIVIGVIVGIKKHCQKVGNSKGRAD